MSVLSVAIRKARTLATFSAVEIALVVPTFLLLGLARLAILVLPFRIYGQWFGAPVGLATPPPPLTSHHLIRAKCIGRVVRSVASVTPWASLCLAQAMVATFLMRLTQLPHCVFFGVAPKGASDKANPLDAHAWVRAGDATLTGGRGLARFTVVQVFEYPVRGQR